MVDFSQYDKDHQDESCDNHLAIFRNSPVMQEFRVALVKQSQELYDVNIDTLLQRTIDDAVAAQLDVIGIIVGQSRVPFGAADLWLTPDLRETINDSSPVWVIGESLENLTVDDDNYRLLIKAKIFKNHVKYGSIPEVTEFSNQVFGFPISIVKRGLQDIGLIISDDFPDDLISLLVSFIDDETTDKQFFLPLPTGTRIISVERIDLLAFRPDDDLLGPDLGEVSVGTGGLI